MKTIYLILVTLLISNSTFALTTLNGKVTYDQGKVLERAWVLVLNADDLSYVTGSVTDEYGNFEIDAIQEGDYILSLHHPSLEAPVTIGQWNNETNLNGKITNDEGEAMERAWVLVLNAGDLSYVTGSVTNSDGDFEIDAVEAGNYVLSVHHPSLEAPVTLGKWNNEMNKMNLKVLNEDIIVEPLQENNIIQYNFEISE